MKKTFIGLFLCVFSSGAIADFYVSVSPELTYFNYAEYETGNKLLVEKGALPGIKFSAGLTNSTQWSFEGYYRFLDGTVDYDGETQLGVTLNTKTNQNIQTVGLTGRLNYSKNLSFHVLFDHNTWARDIQESESVSRLFEQYQWHKFGVGIGYELKPSEKGRVHFNAFVNQILNPAVSVNLASLNIGSVELEMKNKTGGVLDIAYQYVISSEFKLISHLNYEFYAFGESDTVRVSNGRQIFRVSEPYSETKILTATIGLEYTF